MTFIANVCTLARRELRGYAHSPIAWVVGAIFLSVNAFFIGVMLHQRVLDIDDLLGRVSVVLTFLVPLVSMRLLAEELRSGTYESLVTDPVTPAEIVVGKFVGGFAFIGVLLLGLAGCCGVVHVVALERGGLDFAPLATGFLGLALLAAASLAIGLWFSALTRNQIVAAVVTFVVLVLAYLVHLAAPIVAARSAGLADLITYLSARSHVYRFYRGEIALVDVVFFVKAVVVALLFASVALEGRRWK